MRNSRTTRSRLAAILALSATATAVAISAPPSATAALSSPPPTHDHVLDWNTTLLAAYRTATGPYGSPGYLSRAGAMLHAAIWDAENSVAGGPTPAYGFYTTRVTPAAGADSESAIDQAAHDVLVNVFPTQTTLFDSALTTEQTYVPASVTQSQRTAGAAVGRQTAQNMIAARAGDLTDTAATYTGGTTDGSWRPTDPHGTAAVTPGWGKMTPFAIPSVAQYRPSLPAGYSTYSAMLASPEYAAQVNEVESLGAANSTTRTADQTQIAHFWANDLGPDPATGHSTGTYKPPGQLFQLTQTISADHHLGEYANARLFALVGIAMGDAGIVAWDSKYDTAVNLWRPVTAIQNASAAESPNVVKNSAWQPLSTWYDNTPFTPPFPSYISGHSTFAGAWGGVMRDYFGDNVSFTASTEDPFLPAGTQRSFTSITAAADEDAVSRVYLGVHYRWDCDTGLTSGLSVGDYVFHNTLKPSSAISYAGRVATSANATAASSLSLNVGKTVRGGDTLLVSVMLTNTDPGAVAATDSAGNVYTPVAGGDVADGAGDRTLVLAAVGVNPLSTADTITLTFPAAGEHHVAVDDFAGVTSVDRSAASTGPAGTPFTSGTTQPTTSATELVFGVGGIQGGATATWTGGATALPTLFVGNDQLATSYRVVSATGGYAATGTATHQWMASVVTLR